MILLIDNYDSFTYNLYQYLGEVEKDILVKRNDEISLGEIESLNPDSIIISPGPGRPENAGISVDMIKRFYKEKPILGICLGHQAIGTAFGAEVVGAQNIMHGKTSIVKHDGSDLFKNQEEAFPVMRYHSLVIQKGSLPEELKAAAYSDDDGEIMAIRHSTFPLYGLQFHPESIGTLTGKELLHRFQRIALDFHKERMKEITQ
ncbi:anthranilate synthase component II [Bacillus massiliglaciei]|uniref:anthranilate synthase component II n=1 Tax=Bacillus massiliglaciei TaxID=1816693 RepID=UPI000A663BB6|nr:aminodeoxychorismate/anthranilate synthase component II [Bacillus massiliglaciei]